MKEDIRKEIISIRNKTLNKKKKSTIIVDKILNLDFYKKSNVIALYNSLPNEVDISYLIDKSLNNKIVLLPRVNNDILEFIIINKDTKYIKSSFNVLEPIGTIYHDKIDLIIVPGVSFDKKLNRLGYGKGFYDKYLSNNNSYKVGVCFSNQIVNELPSCEHDIKMDMVITEKEVYK